MEKENSEEEDFKKGVKKEKDPKKGEKDKK